MLQSHRGQRGSANWPFIITLILFLVFGYMWFDEKGKREGAQEKETKATEQTKETLAAIEVLRQYANDLSNTVGWASWTVDDLLKDDNVRKQVGTNGYAALANLTLTNPAALEAQLTPNGTVDTPQGPQPGLYNWLRNNAKVTIDARLRSKKADGTTETQVSFDWMKPEFRQKIQETLAMARALPAPPVLPADPDDTEAKRRYDEDLKRYEAANDEFTRAMDGLAQMEGWEQYGKVITSAPLFDPATMQAVEVNFFAQQPSGSLKIEELLAYPAPIIKAVISEYAVNKAEDWNTITSAQANAQAKAEEVQRVQQELADEQGRHTTDVQALNAELQSVNENLNRARQEATVALQAKAVEEDAHKRDVRIRDERIAAEENRRRIDKEQRDLQIRRNEPDGNVLAASPQLGTAIINLGSGDKVFPGLKFEVSAPAYGGTEVVKGEVQVIQVTGAHSASVRILSTTTGNPIGRGDVLKNPLYSATETIHVYFAGTPSVYPGEMTKARLAKLNVVVDSAISGQTDYVIVPDSMTAPSAAPSEEDGGDEEPAAGGKSPYEEIQDAARRFGATIISEKMFNAFLSY